MLQGNIKRLRNPILHQTLSQSDAQVAGQDFDDILTFARGQDGQAILQQFGLSVGAARAMQVLEQLARFTGTEWLRRRSPIQNFERTSASVPVGAGDAMKFRVVDVGGGLQRAEDYCPANLQCAQIALGKCPSGKVEGRDRELLAG